MVREYLRIDVDSLIQAMIKDPQNMTGVVQQTRGMCRETSKVISTTHCDALLSNLQFKYEDIVRKIEEVLNVLEARSSKMGLLGKALTAFFSIIDEVCRYIDDQLMELQTLTRQNVLLNARVEAYPLAVFDRLEEFGGKLNSVIRAVNEMSSGFRRVDSASLTVQVVSAYLTAVDYYDENSKRILSMLYSRGDLQGLLTKNTLTKVVDVRNKIGPSFEILPIPLERKVLHREGDQMKIFGFLCIVGPHDYRLLHVTAIPRVDGEWRYLIPQINVPMIAIDYGRENYFKLNLQHPDRWYAFAIHAFGDKAGCFSLHDDDAAGETE